MRLGYTMAVLLTALNALSLPALGQEWRRVESGVTSYLYDVYFVNNNVGWVVGTDSVILKTTDGGNTWFRQNHYIGARNGYSAVWFNDENHGWVAGAQAGGISLILHTEDGGETWTRQYCDANNLYDIQFTSPDTGYIVTGRHVDGRVYRTTNGGQEWVALGDNLPLQHDFEGEFKGLSFISNTEGWIGGTTGYVDIYDDKMIFHTTDAGETWEQQDTYGVPGPIEDIHFINEDIGFAGGIFSSMMTTNGGRTWEQRQPDNLLALYVLDEKHIYASRNNLLVSSDFGMNWVPIQTEGGAEIRGLFLTDTAHGWAVGADGKIWVHGPTESAITETVSPSAHGLTAFPNPVGNGTTYGALLTIDVAGHSPASRILINDILGRNISVSARTAATSTGMRFIIDTSSLTSGVYFVSQSSTNIGAILSYRIHIIH